MIIYYGEAAIDFIQDELGWDEAETLTEAEVIDLIEYIEARNKERDKHAVPLEQVTEKAGPEAVAIDNRLPPGDEDRIRDAALGAIGSIFGSDAFSTIDDEPGWLWHPTPAPRVIISNPDTGARATFNEETSALVVDFDTPSGLPHQLDVENPRTALEEASATLPDPLVLPDLATYDWARSGNLSGHSSFGIWDLGVGIGAGLDTRLMNNIQTMISQQALPDIGSIIETVSPPLVNPLPQVQFAVRPPR